MLLFIFLKSARNTISNNIINMLLKAIGSGSEKMNRRRHGKKIRFLYEDFR
jgi:hypothetical protein